MSVVSEGLMIGWWGGWYHYCHPYTPSVVTRCVFTFVYQLMGILLVRRLSSCIYCSTDNMLLHYMQRKLEQCAIQFVCVVWIINEHLYIIA